MYHLSEFRSGKMIFEDGFSTPVDASRRFDPGAGGFDVSDSFVLSTPSQPARRASTSPEEPPGQTSERPRSSRRSTSRVLAPRDPGSDPGPEAAACYLLCNANCATLAKQRAEEDEQAGLQYEE